MCCRAVKTGDYFYIRHDHKIICGTDYNLQFGSSKFLIDLSMGSSLLIICFVSWSKMTISTNINNGLLVPLMCYLFIILIFRTLA